MLNQQGMPVPLKKRQGRINLCHFFPKLYFCILSCRHLLDDPVGSSGSLNPKISANNTECCPLKYKRFCDHRQASMCKEDGPFCLSINQGPSIYNMVWNSAMAMGKNILQKMNLNTAKGCQIKGIDVNHITYWRYTNSSVMININYDVSSRYGESIGAQNMTELIEK